ncbi:Ribosome biogenesis protein NSA2 [Nosema granulosis]|uniref:Ribosome biogenesis protein NSA2 homolog n=1 Tax=Nosema granulosis TaxID=83296 RepID=A0A9P6KZP3_9MICR|nr:Ribosome biogenesis protein NSA2 [Nosema granulosis]
MPQNNFVEQHIKKYGRRLDYEVKKLKKEARAEATLGKKVKNLHGIKAKLFMKKRYNEKVQLKKNLKINENRKKNVAVKDDETPIPHFLLDRENQQSGKELSDKIKQQRQDRAAKYSVPIPEVKGLTEAEVFGVVTTGKRRSKHWKRMVTKPCFVGPDFTRKPPKLERFIRPMALRFKKAHVSHPELKTTFHLPIIGIKQNPHSDIFTNLGVLTKGTIIEVNVSELGIVNAQGNITWGKYAQITNHPENDGCINATLLV